MSPRLRAIVLLLRSFDWFEPQPETSTGNIVRRGSKPGEGPSMKVDCALCEGTGEIRKRGMPAPCPSLGCRGGKVTVDAYTLRPISTDEAYVPEVKVVTCETCAGQRRLGNGKTCLRCRGSGVNELTMDQWRAAHGPVQELRLTLEVGIGSVDPVSAAIDRRDELGSYWQLGLALGELRAAWYDLYRLVLDAYVAGEEIEDERLIKMLGWGLDFLDARMPAEILVPPGVLIAERNRKARERVAKRLREETAA